jgi:hypothetical protein
MYRFTNILSLAVISLILVSCGIYSFTGASIPPGAKTVSVEYFKNNAPIFNPTLSQDLTEKLQSKLVSQTSLKLTDGSGDLQFKGQIVDYSVSPAGLVSNETAAQNRLTIRVKVEFINEFDQSLNFNQTFTRYQDYPSDKALAEAESELVPGIIDQIVDDIFQKAVVNW